MGADDEHEDHDEQQEQVFVASVQQYGEPEEQHEELDDGWVRHGSQGRGNVDEWDVGCRHEEGAWHDQQDDGQWIDEALDDGQ